jgi:hypothetical protein
MGPDGQERRKAERRNGDRREADRRAANERERQLAQLRNTLSAWAALRADRAQQQEEVRRGRFRRRRRS